ncbi:MAG: hypothetical protein PXY39_12925, partial [archaeon]|nr:hypothetical protein [archaeon]
MKSVQLHFSSKHQKIVKILFATAFFAVFIYSLSVTTGLFTKNRIVVYNIETLIISFVIADLIMDFVLTKKNGRQRLRYHLEEPFFDGREFAIVGYFTG